MLDFGLAELLAAGLQEPVAVSADKLRVCGAAHVVVHDGREGVLEGLLEEGVVGEVCFDEVDVFGVGGEEGFDEVGVVVLEGGGEGRVSYVLVNDIRSRFFHFLLISPSPSCPLPPRP